MGKTFAMRVVLLAAALDPGVQLRVFELKGTGDLSDGRGLLPPLRLRRRHPHPRRLHGLAARPLHRVGQAGRDDPAAAARDLPGEQGHPPALRPPRARAVPGRGMFIDECQELFSHPDYKDEAARLAEAIIKRGPALGIILVLATQRPDASSLPTGVSANVGIRFCLRVMGQTENDMVLGTSSYKNGLRATTFGPRDKGIGYLVGATDDPQIVRTAYIDGPAAEAIGARARALREAAGHAVRARPRRAQRPAGRPAAALDPG